MIYISISQRHLTIDSVSHDLILKKLKEEFGINGLMLRFIKSYLQGRQQEVVIGGVKSGVLPVKSGVPQGSILGPLLFLLYINDISLKSRDVNIDIYADDSTLYASGFQLCDVQDKLQENISYIMEWCKVNNMSLNPSKSTCMTIATSHKLTSLSPLQLKLNSQPLRNDLGCLCRL